MRKGNLVKLNLATCFTVKNGGERDYPLTHSANDHAGQIEGYRHLTEDEVNAKIAELETAEPFRLLREERNKLIAETDFPQIYKIKNTVCIQFHPEVTVELFDKWYESEVSKKELKNYDVELTRNKLINYENSMNQKVNSFYKKWKDA